MDPIRGRAKSWLVASALVAGAAIGGAGIAHAATDNSSSSSGSASSTAASDPSTLTHGPGETLLTGSTADSVTSAALAAVPGATVIRVETDSAGAAYEAHLKKSDGSVVTVKLDSSFNVTGTEDGFGAGGGQPPAGAQSSTSDTSNA